MALPSIVIPAAQTAEAIPIGVHTPVVILIVNICACVNEEDSPYVFAPSRPLLDSIFCY